MALSGFMTTPLYLQLRDILAARIAKGEWKRGSPIPNELDLAREYGVSVGTMRKALSLLHSQRLVSRERGRGTFVTDPSSAEQNARFDRFRGPDGQPVVLARETATITEGAADAGECERLSLAPGERVFRSRRLSFLAERPFMLEQAVWPAQVFPGLHRNAVPPCIATLAQHYGILLGKAEERISVLAASTVDMDSLGVPPASPIMVLDRVMRAHDGRAIEWRVGRCHLGGHHYRAEMN